MSYNCPICNLSTNHNLYNSFFYCHNCDFAFKTSPNTTNKNLLYNHNWLTTTESHSSIQNRLNIAYDTITNLIKSGNILEIGFGNANLMVRLQGKGYKVDGLDIVDYLIALAKTKINGNIYKGDLSLSSINDSHIYDLVIMLHVLEHSSDLSKCLSGVKRVLKPNGLLYLEVPNMDSRS